MFTGALVACVAVGWAGPAGAQELPIEDGGETETGGLGGGLPPVTLPLVPVPAGCEAPPLPHVVFTGRVADADYRSVQFEVERIRAGATAPFATGSLVNIRYGLDAQYLDAGQRYLVSALVDPDLGILVSRVTEPIENFGGDEVIGVSESDVTCPRFDDPMRTLELDGTQIDAGVVKPLLGAKVRILGSLLIPAVVAFGAIFLLATLRLSVAGLYRTVSSGHRRT